MADGRRNRASSTETSSARARGRGSSARPGPAVGHHREDMTVATMRPFVIRARAVLSAIRRTDRAAAVRHPLAEAHRDRARGRIGDGELARTIAAAGRRPKEISE